MVISYHMIHHVSVCKPVLTRGYHSRVLPMKVSIFATFCLNHSTESSPAGGKAPEKKFGF